MNFQCFFTCMLVGIAHCLLFNFAQVTLKLLCVVYETGNIEVHARNTVTTNLSNRSSVVSHGISAINARAKKKYVKTLKTPIRIRLSSMHRNLDEFVLIHEDSCYGRGERSDSGFVL